MLAMFEDNSTAIYIMQHCDVAVTSACTGHTSFEGGGLLEVVGCVCQLWFFFFSLSLFALLFVKRVAFLCNKDVKFECRTAAL